MPQLGQNEQNSAATTKKPIKSTSFRNTPQQSLSWQERKQRQQQGPAFTELIELDIEPNYQIMQDTVYDPMGRQVASWSTFALFGGDDYNEFGGGAGLVGFGADEEEEMMGDFHRSSSKQYSQQQEQSQQQRHRPTQQRRQGRKTLDDGSNFPLRTMAHNQLDKDNERETIIWDLLFDRTRDLYHDDLLETLCDSFSPTLITILRDITSTLKNPTPNNPTFDKRYLLYSLLAKWAWETEFFDLVAEILEDRKGFRCVDEIFKDWEEGIPHVRETEDDFVEKEALRFTRRLQPRVDKMVKPDAHIKALRRMQNSKRVPNHPTLQPLADFFHQEQDDFEEHEGIFIQIGPESKTLQGAFVHRTMRGPGAGGVRNWIYDSLESFIRDGLRLSKGMSHKNALAGIWWGGGKGVISRNSGRGLLHTDSKEARRVVYEEYGRFMSELKGCYVTAEDAGTSVEDMAHLFSQTRFTTCIPERLGGSGNPSVPTAKGVLKALEAAFEFSGLSIVGSRIAVQGVGHVGTPLCHFLLERGVGKIIASDIDAHRAGSLRTEFEKYGPSKFELRIVGKEDVSVLFEDVDAVSPCATGGILNKTTIPKIKSKIVCGAANNQLLDIKTDDKLLQAHGILYIPDFLANRMGIVNCADEHMGSLEDDPKLEMHLGRDWENSVYNLSMRVMKEAREMGRTTQEIAIKLADERSREVNPLYGHRGVEIIKSLVGKDQSWRRKVGLS
ncbi:hypothetical protein HDV05_001606 [Chytridiales sp. JEL 0842]|nr:hypothetical protein HDV05_001606 [Chytridiales sp. JEL 0842]